MKENKVNIYNSGRLLVPEDNGKQNPKESYTNIYQKHIALLAVMTINLYRLLIHQYYVIWKYWDILAHKD